MPKSVLPKAESEQASAGVTVEMRTVLREGRSSFMRLLRPICGQAALARKTGFARDGLTSTKTTTLQKETLRLLEARHRRAHRRRTEQDARARASEQPARARCRRIHESSNK